MWAASAPSQPKLSWPAQSTSANDFKQFEYLDSTGFVSDTIVNQVAQRLWTGEISEPEHLAGLGIDLRWKKRLRVLPHRFSGELRQRFGDTAATS